MLELWQYWRNVLRSHFDVFIISREGKEMKKGLSVLLIAAALFGFYGGAVNLNDVLACKDYWEEEGERSTADMNKLEDGLNQLKENEQAYLDGVEQIADGEIALAEGEEAYADGQATLAQGEADYAAAPGKLAAGRAKLRKGEAALTEAIAKRRELRKVKSKLEEVEPAYQPWLNKFNKLRTSIVDNPDNPSKGVLYDAGATAVGLVTVNSGFDAVEKAGKDGMAEIETGVKNNIVANVKAQMPEGTTDKEAKAYAEAKGLLSDAKVKEAINGSPYASSYAQAEGAVQLANYLKNTYSADLLTAAGAINADIESIKGAEYQATALRNSTLSSYAKTAEGLMDKFLADPMVTGNSQALAQLIGGAKQVKGLASAAQSSKSEYDKNYDELKPNASLGNKVGTKVAAAAKAVLSNEDMKDAMTGKQISALKPYMQSGAITSLPNIELLYGTMTLGADKLDDGKNSLLDSLKALKDGASGGIGQYNAGISDGEDQLKAGRAEYRKGLAEYKAAPAKLADGRAKLADAAQQLEDGRKELADGKEQLAEYEDGEQQVRDGLATLMGTTPDGGLTSILDRRNGDDDFDNGDNHLELDEGLEAVTVGRGYQADSGELITKEITGRAIGTAAGLGAGALAVLAAILSFLKKNKGAGVCAILAAAAGAAGIAYGTSAGMEFSNIAGSTVGSLPWVAAGVLAAVAAVHAIAHFASKEA